VADHRHARQRTLGVGAQLKRWPTSSATRSGTRLRHQPPALQTTDKIGRQTARDPELSRQLDATDARRRVHRPQDLRGTRAGEDLELIAD